MGKNSYSYQCSLIFLHMKGECNKTMLTVTIYCVRKKKYHMVKLVIKQYCLPQALFSFLCLSHS